METLIKVKVTGLTIDPFTNMPIIILKDLEETTALPIWIGLIEASSIATELEKVELSRPMTHDLMKNILDTLGATVERVEVTDLLDNTFFSKVVIQKNGKEFSIDSRPSDAIALALRVHCDIFVAREVLDKSREIDLSKKMDQGEVQEQKWTEILENLNPEDFGKYKM